MCWEVLFPFVSFRQHYNFCKRLWETYDEHWRRCAPCDELPPCACNLWRDASWFCSNINSSHFWWTTDYFSTARFNRKWWRSAPYYSNTARLIRIWWWSAPCCSTAYNIDLLWSIDFRCTWLLPSYQDDQPYMDCYYARLLPACESRKPFEDYYTRLLPACESRKPFEKWWVTLNNNLTLIIALCFFYDC